MFCFVPPKNQTKLPLAALEAWSSPGLGLWPHPCSSPCNPLWAFWTPGAVLAVLVWLSSTRNWIREKKKIKIRAPLISFFPEETCSDRGPLSPNIMLSSFFLGACHYQCGPNHVQPHQPFLGTLWWTRAGFWAGQFGKKLRGLPYQTIHIHIPTFKRGVEVFKILLFRHWETREEFKYQQQFSSPTAQDQITDKLIISCSVLFHSGISHILALYGTFFFYPNNT